MMKWTTIVLSVLLCSVAVFAAPLSLCDFHSPQTSLTDLRLSVSYRYFDNPAVAGVEVNSGKIGLDYLQLFDSVDYGFTLSGGGSVNLDDFAIDGGLGQGNGTFRYYLTEELPVFGFGGANVSYSFGQSQPAASVSVGVGYGRFSDVTPMAKAMTIQKDLISLGAISGPLSDDALMAVAEEIGRRVEYSTIKELVAAIEPIIEQTAGVTLDARALLTVEDDILATGDEASCGWALQAGLGYELIDASGGAQDVLVTISGDASLAPAPGSQLTLHGAFYGPFDILSENTLTASGVFDYALKQDVNLILNYQLQRIQPLIGNVSESQSITASVSFNIGQADIAVEAGLTKGSGATGWSQEITISAGMDLL